jgi:hypothetical protein
MKEPGPVYLKKRHFTSKEVIEALSPLERRFADTLIAAGDLIVIPMDELEHGSAEARP